MASDLSQPPTPPCDPGSESPLQLRRLASCVLLHAIRVARTTGRCWWDYTDTPEAAAAFLRGDPGNAEDLAYWCHLADINYESMTTWARASGWNSLPPNWNYTWSDISAEHERQQRLLPRYADGHEHLIDSDFHDAVGNTAAFFRLLDAYCAQHQLQVSVRSFHLGDNRSEQAFKVVPRFTSEADVASAVAAGDPT